MLTAACALSFETRTGQFRGSALYRRAASPRIASSDPDSTDAPTAIQLRRQRPNQLSIDGALPRAIVFELP